MDHPAVLVKSHNVDRDHLTVEIDTLQTFGGDNVVGIIERWDYEDLIPDAIVHVNTIITNTCTLSSSNRRYVDHIVRISICVFGVLYYIIFTSSQKVEVTVKKIKPISHSCDRHRHIERQIRRDERAVAPKIYRKHIFPYVRLNSKPHPSRTDHHETITTITSNIHHSTKVEKRVHLSNTS
jgi:hypothetical protein